MQVFRSIAICLISACILFALPVSSIQALAQPAAQSKPALKIATIERKPFAFRTADGVTGFSIELWRAIARKISRQSSFEVKKTFPEMLSSVRDGSVDAAIANITINAARETVMDFSHPIFDSGLRIMVRSDSDSGGLIGAIFNWDMAALIGIAGLFFILSGSLMWWFERRHQEYFKVPYREGIWRSFWWSLNVLLQGGFEERVPQSARGRIFAVLMVIASLFVVSAFVAKITASLTVGELKSQIQNHNDLYGKKVATTTGSTSAAFLRGYSIAFTGFESVDKLLAALERKKLDAVVHDSPILSYYANTIGRGRVKVVGPLLRPEKYGIAFPANSPLTEEVNRALLALQEDGSFDALQRKWFGAQ